MKKKNVLNLIKYYSEKRDDAFRTESYEIAKYFDKIGDYQLAEYIMGLLSDTNVYVPQINETKYSYLIRLNLDNKPLFLPEIIKEDFIGIVNAIKNDTGVNKFLFEGAPGTGKTETAKQLARILERELFIVDFTNIVDSKLGQTSKNIVELFNEINKIPYPEKVIILFDEIDILAVDRINSNDLREMGRATSTVLKGLDNLNEKIVLIATTNLYSAFDKALIRRFDSVINYNRYTKEDLIEIAGEILDKYLIKFKKAGKNTRLFKKILNYNKKIPYPGEMSNILKTSLAFSDLTNNNLDYLRRLFNTLNNNKKIDLKELQQNNFSVREVEILTGISKSKVSRELKEG